jgi:lipopolysaccharide transport system permease protein
MYATPVVYSITSVPTRFQILVQLNPLTPIIETFRYAFLGAGSVTVPGLIYSFVFMLLSVLVGAVIFNRVEATFMDTV